MRMPARLPICACLLLAAAPVLAEINLPAPEPAPPQKPAAPAQAPAPRADVLSLGNHDLLHGQLLGISADGLLLWQHPGGGGPFRFKTDALDCVAFGPSAPPTPAPAADNMLVRLRNGDALPGRLVSFGPQETVLDTWYAGRLTFKSSAVRSLVPVAAPGQAGHFSGFGKQEDWKIGNGGPRQMKVAAQQLSLFGGAQAGRLLPLAAKYRLDLEFKTDTAQGMDFWIALGAGKPEQGGNLACHTLRVTGNRVDVERCARDGSSESLGRFQGRFDTGKLRLTVFADTESGGMIVMANGATLGSVHDPQEFPSGKVLAIGINTVGELRVTNLSLSPWTGITDEGVGKDREGDTLFLANSDAISGTLQSIQNGKAELTTEFGAMSVPLSRVAGIRLKSPPKAAGSTRPAPPPAGSARVFLNDFDRITLRLGAIGQDGIAGTSDTLGPCVIRRAAAHKIVFNLDAPFRQEAEEQEKTNQKAAREAGDILSATE